MKRLATMILWCSATFVAWSNQPLKGFTYGRVPAPTGKEWQSPEHYAHGKEQPHATFYSFDSESSALGVLPEQSKYYHSLDGKWRFHWVGNPEERPSDFYLPKFDDSAWDVVDVPMNWNVYGLQPNGEQRYGTPIYVNQPVIFQHQVAVDDWRGGVMRTPPAHWTTYKHRNEVGSYRKSFAVPREWLSRSVFIQFDGVDSFFYLWINGQYVGFSKNSRNRAEFDISPYLRSGENVVAVEVYRSSDGSFLESQDMFRLPGIFRSVGIVSRPKLHVRDLSVVPRLSDGTGALDVTIELRNQQGKAAKDLSVAWALYTLPLYSDNGAKRVGVVEEQKMSSATVQAGEAIKLNTRLALANAKTWTAEAPHRYVLVGALRDKKGNTLEYISTYTGFRTVEIKDTPAHADEFRLAGRYFFINGKPAKLKGVNRHETHPSLGHAITREIMHEEVMLMKRANINHVRNSHYPTDPYFYYLCDKYGIYLEDEANVESHQYYYGEASLSHVKEFEIAHVNRMLEMVIANRNHPSIVIWSLGNEGGPGVNFEHAYRATKLVDTTRPIQYERNNEIVDMGSNQYPSIPWVQEAVKGKYNIKYPFHISEYAHSMGNAVGGLQDYWTAIESTNFFCGGAIWDWVDQSLYNYLPDGTRYMAYGGDFGDTPNDGMFVMNGIIFADRTPKPQYYEVKKVYQNVEIKGEDLSKGTIRIFNKHYYVDLSDYELRYSVSKEGEVIYTATIPTPSIAPRTSAVVSLDLPNLPAGKECFLKVELVLLNDQPWAKSGYTQMQEQLLLQSATLAPRTTAKERVQVKDFLRENTPRIELMGENFYVRFDGHSGIMSDLIYGSDTIIMNGNGPRIDAFRAACDNDNWALSAWGKNGLHNLKHSVLSSQIYERADGSAVVSFTVKSQAPHGALIYDVRASGRYRIEEESDRPFTDEDFMILSTQTWTIHPDGMLELQAAITSNQPKLPLGRIGFELRLPKKYQNYTYYGRGPINNYSDRKTGQFVELHRSTVADQFVHFPKPQTMGNREDVRWLTLTDNSGKGFLVQAGTTMSASALPWSAKELLLAPHPHELPESEYTYLHLDASVNGLGGNSCGQGGPLAHCRSFAAEQIFALAITPYSGQRVERVRLAGDVAPIVSRSARGEISIIGRAGETFDYSINGSKWQRYTIPFTQIEAATIIARSTSTRLTSKVSLPRLKALPLQVFFVSSEEATTHPAKNLVDGDPTTIWHTMNTVTVSSFPHWVDFDAGAEVKIVGFNYTPRQEDWRSGSVKDYIISISTDAQTWTEVARGAFPDSGDTQHVAIVATLGRYIRFMALSNQWGTDHATGADFSIITE